MSTVLITGATGFVGSALLEHMAAVGNYTTMAAVRKQNAVLHAADTTVCVGDLSADTDWRDALSGVGVVVHCAARVHVMRDGLADPLAEFRRVNVDGTLNLARQAVEAGVRRFVYISSVKVNGESTRLDQPFMADDAPAPVDSYGISKREAEEGLRLLAAETGLEVVVIRPPLVYGLGVKANFRSMMAWVHKGLPLPLGAIHNKRSLVALGNLVDLITVCVDHPAAANKTFFVSDGEDLSITQLLRRMGAALGRPARLLPVPAVLLTSIATLLGRKHVVQRLCGSLRVDTTFTCETLGWQPPLSVDEALKQTADAYRAELFRAGSESVGSNRLQSVVLRMLDVVFSALGLIGGSPVLLGLLIAGYFDTGSPLFRQQRVGRNQQSFVLVKFRTMRLNTASVATHLADTMAVTPLGRFMRKTKLDELPQLWNVLKGDMSLVGPRPGLFNQLELTDAREKHGVFVARPGITGLAQINNIDMSTPELLAQTDRRMLKTLTVGSYFKYILRTVTGKGAGDAIRKS